MGNIGKGKLTPRQKDLAEYFLDNECKKDKETLIKIYKKAGFSGADHSNCLRALDLPQVREYIQQRIQEVMALPRNTNLTLQTLMDKYTTWMNFDIRKLVDEDNEMRDIHDLDSATAACVSGIDIETTTTQLGTITVKKKPKVINPKDAADSLARIITGGFGNTVDVNVRGDVNVKGGVMVMPALMTQEQWVSAVPELKKYKSEQKKLIGFDNMVRVSKKEEKR
jgi:hypothetical protein